MLSVYRIAYGLILAVFLANVLKVSDFSVWPVHVSALFVVAVLAICGVLAVLVRFTRVPIGPLWVVVIVWEMLFTWYAWFSPAAPFALHELHTLEPTKMGEEASRHYVRSGVLFVLLFGWFLSLVFVRLRYGRTKKGWC